MDDELKVVVSSVLEANEDESAQRIAAQLPSIAAKVNSKSKIKIQVEMDHGGVQSEVQKIGKELSKAAKHSVGVNVSINRGSIQKIQSELNGLGVNQDITKSITAEMDKMGVRIDQVSGAWRKCVDDEERMLNLTIQGTDQLGRTLTIAKQFSYVAGDTNGELEEQSSTITRITSNLEKQRQTEAAIAAKTAANNDARLAFLAKQQTELGKVKALYQGATSVKPVLDQGHLNKLAEEYKKIENHITSMRGTEGKLSRQQQMELTNEITVLKQLATEYQNAEYIALKLQAKTATDVNQGQVKSLTQYEDSLRNAGILTEQFQNEIGNLKTQLETAFDRKSLTAFLNQFDQLKASVNSFKEQLTGVNAGFSDLSSVEKRISDLKIKMGRVPTGSQEYAGLRNELAIQLKLRKQITAEIGAQVSKNPALLTYSQQYNQYLSHTAENAARLSTEQGKVADSADEVGRRMEKIPDIIQNIQTRFRSLDNPTSELVQKVRSLTALSNEVGRAKTNADKVAAYNRLQEAISGCNAEITSMLRLQRADLGDFQFAEKLKKAQADLETVSRQWSAFKNNANLSGEFHTLKSQLSHIDTPGELKKWTASFSRFKSEVKAAGLNVKTLGDTIKDNFKKVAEWATATSMLYRAFRLLKDGVSSVIELDTAMIDLRKTTDATNEEYEKFYSTANQTAKELGSTTKAVIEQTAEWSRLGYSMKEAAELARNSAIFAAVSPEMDQAMATDGLVSIIKAFGIDVNDTMDGIISKVNEVGNKFAVSNADIVEALTRSSSAMAAANNTFDETVALATAAIEITRDASSVGNGLKTLSMRIRGYDEETEEYIGGIEELTGAIADLTKTARNTRGVSLFEANDPNTYRSTYDILADIADIWDELTDKNRAKLLEALFGKRQAQIGAAIISNFDQASKSISTMERSAGSAGREMEAIMDSLDYKINKFKETWVGISKNLFDEEAIGFVIEAVTSLSSHIATITDKLGLLGTVAVSVLGTTLVKTVGRPKMTGFMCVIVPTYALVVTRNECIV